MNKSEWFRPPNAQGAVTLYEELLRDPAVTAYIAEDESGQTLGFVIARVIRRLQTPVTWAATIVDIDQIGVSPSARRRGVGHNLFQAIRELANEVSATLLHLTTWEFNTGAQSFFEAEGLAVEMRRMAMPWPTG